MECAPCSRASSWRVGRRTQPVSHMIDEPTREMQHLVSKGYQRNFARDGHLSILDPRTAAVIDERRSIKSNWRVKNFLSVVNDASVDDRLEREFARDEQKILNVIRDIQPFQRLTPVQKSSLDLLTAIHLTRSHAFKESHDSIAGNFLANGAMKIADEPELLIRFTRSLGREPYPGELKQLVAVQAEAFGKRPDLLAESIRSGTGTLNELLASRRVELVALDEKLPGFVLADVPILHGFRDSGRFGYLAAGAVGDADTIVVPISRWLAASYTSKRPRDKQISTKQGWSWVNSQLIRGGRSEVACHPDDRLDVERLIRNLDRFPPAKFSTATIR